LQNQLKRGLSRAQSALHSDSFVGDDTMMDGGATVEDKWLQQAWKELSLTSALSHANAEHAEQGP